MAKPHFLPNGDRLSVLAAMILLAYALTRFIDLPTQILDFQLPGIYVPLQINLYTVIAFITAGLTASGASWLLYDHPALRAGNTLEHWILPAMAAWVLGLLLFEIPTGILWWSVLGLGVGLLILVLVAEYIVVDTSDVRYPPASAILTALSFALFLILAIVLREAEFRLYLVLPGLAVAAGLVGLRTLRLRLRGQWRVLEALVIALIVGQLIAPLHYWPFSPVAFGLAVLGPAYALTSLIRSLTEGEGLRQALVEPGLALGLSWAAALWTR